MLLACRGVEARGLHGAFVREAFVSMNMMDSISNDMLGGWRRETLLEKNMIPVYIFLIFSCQLLETCIILPE